MKRPALCVLVAAAALLLGVDRPRGLSDVVEVRHWSYPDYTRVVVETSAPVKIASPVRWLGADAKAGRPARLYVDIEGAWVGRRYVDGIEVSDGLLQGVRLGQFTLGSTRLVLDLQNYERHRLIELSHPHRVVIDVYGSRRGPGGAPAPPRPSPLLRPVRTVVLDPGHGGKDPGALGLSGVREKNVTLRIAKALGRRLVDRGFQVVYTRTGDRTVSLEERTALAEASRADIFVSIHANASRRRSVKGIETYYLDENHTRHTLRVAARENGIPRGELDALQRTVARLRVSEVSPQSRLLAEYVHGELIQGLPRSYGSVEDLGVKKGPFYVLFLSDMPAILVETGFVTNRREAKRFRDEDYVEAVSEHMARGISRYRSSRATLAHRAGP